MKKNKTLLSALSLIGLTTIAMPSLLTSCKKNTQAKVLDSISITKGPTQKEYEAGNKLDLTGLVVTAKYNDQTTKPVTGYTTNPSSDTQLTTDMESVTVTYTEGGVTKTASFGITVKEKVTISLSRTEKALGVGADFTLTAIVHGTEEDVVWKAEDTENGTHASITEQTGRAAKIKGNTAGKTTITATVAGKSATCVVTVSVTEIKVSSVEITNTTTEVIVGKNLELKAKVLPENATNKELNWVITSGSENAEFAYPNNDDKNPELKGKCAGTVKIQAEATDGSHIKSAEKEFTVKEEVTISLDETSHTVFVGANFTLTAIVRGTKEDVVWKVEDTANDTHASIISSTGRTATITGNTSGKTTITATVGGKSATCVVTVADKVLEDITITKQPTKIIYRADDTLDLTGLEVTAKYNDQTTKPVTGYTTNPPEGTQLTTDMKSVTVTYTEGNVTKTASFDITVKEKVTISLNPAEKALGVGTDFTLTAIVSGTDEDVVWKVEDTVNDTHASIIAQTARTAKIKGNTIGKTTITATVAGKSATCVVTVADKVLEDIAITKQPTKIVYRAGDTLDLTGLVVTAKYSDKSEQPVTDYTTNPPKGTQLTTDMKSVTVTYTEGDVTKTASFRITVIGQVTDTIIIDDDGNQYKAHMDTICAIEGDIKATKITGAVQTWKRDEFNCEIILPSITNIPSYFLCNCKSFNKPLTIPNSVTSIGISFLEECISFNQPLTIPNSVTSIENSFLYNCRAFNQPLTIPNSVTSISQNFLYSCVNFNQPLTIPKSVTDIDFCFLNGCTAFNNTIDFSAIVDPKNFYIQTNMLSDVPDANNIKFLVPRSTAWEWKTKIKTATGKETEWPETWTFEPVGPVTLPTIIDEEGNAYRAHMDTICAKSGDIKATNITTGVERNWQRDEFNCEIILPSNMTNISDSFLCNCKSFNKPLTIPNGVTSIGNNFLDSCISFNKPLTISNGVTSIGQHFLSGCKTFNQQLTIPNSVNWITFDFLNGCTAFNNTIDFSAITTDPKNVTIGGGMLFDVPSTNTIKFLVPRSTVWDWKNKIKTATGKETEWPETWTFEPAGPVTLPTIIDEEGNAYKAHMDTICAKSGDIKATNITTGVERNWKRDEFNCEIILPSNMTNISDSFLYNCTSFNKQLTIPNSVTSIGHSFLYNCRAFNQPLTIPNAVTSIDNYFLFNCVNFNQPLIIPNSVTKIGDDFLAGCTAFSNTIDFSAITADPKNFIGMRMLFDVPSTNTIKFKIPSTTASEWENKIKTATGKETEWPETWTFEKV